MKLRFLLLIFISILVVACGSEEDNTEPPAELVEFDASAKVEKIWDVSIGGGTGQHFLRIYPLLLKDRIVVADRNGNVEVVDIDTGDSIWSVDLDVIISGGVGGNDEFYVVTTRDGDVILLDAKDGKVIWRNSVSSEVLVPADIIGNKLIVRTVDGKIIALSLQAGKQQWVYKRDVPALSLRGSSRLLVSQNTIFAGLDSGRIVALNDSGKPLFDSAITIPSGKSELERIIDIDGDIILDKGILYIASFQGSVVAIDVRRGQLIWKRKLSTYTGVEVADSTLFSADEYDHLWALDRTNGATLWKMDKLSARRITKPVAMGEAVVVADEQGYLHWVSQYDGHFIVRVDADSSGYIVSPLVRGNRLYALSRDGDLAAYQYIKE